METWGEPVVGYRGTKPNAKKGPLFVFQANILYLDAVPVGNLHGNVLKLGKESYQLSVVSRWRVTETEGPVRWRHVVLRHGVAVAQGNALMHIEGPSRMG